jgi:hypothetical protein
VRFTLPPMRFGSAAGAEISTGSSLSSPSATVGARAPSEATAAAAAAITGLRTTRAPLPFLASIRFPLVIVIFLRAPSSPSTRSPTGSNAAFLVGADDMSEAGPAQIQGRNFDDGA